MPVPRMTHSQLPCGWVLLSRGSAGMETPQEAICHGPSQYLISKPPVPPGVPCGPGPGRLLPDPVAACTSAFLECVCTSDICIFEAFKNSIFVMRANEE